MHNHHNIQYTVITTFDVNVLVFISSASTANKGMVFCHSSFLSIGINVLWPIIKSLTTQNHRKQTHKNRLNNFSQPNDFMPKNSQDLCISNMNSSYEYDTSHKTLCVRTVNVSILCGVCFSLYIVSFVVVVSVSWFSYTKSVWKCCI